MMTQNVTNSEYGTRETQITKEQSFTRNYSDTFTTAVSSPIINVRPMFLSALDSSILTRL